jgi:hypothetical protein
MLLALRRTFGEVTVMDEIVQQATKTAQPADTLKTDGGYLDRTLQVRTLCVADVGHENHRPSQVEQLPELCQDLPCRGLQPRDRATYASTTQAWST